MIILKLLILFILSLNSFGLESKVAGFGTVAIDHNGNTGGDFVTTMEQTQGVGFSTNTTMNPDTVFGVQADINTDSKLGATFQVVSRSMIDNTFTPYFEWANLQYKMNDDLMFRFGRLSNDIFLYSENRLVGFVRPTIHLPYTYMMNPISLINGGDIEYSRQVNGIVYFATVNYGVFNQDYDIEAPAVVGDKFLAHYRGGDIHLGVNLNSNQTLKFTYESGKIDMIDSNFNLYRMGLGALVSMGVPGAASEYNITSVNAVDTKFFGLSYNYDDGKNALTAEWFRRDVTSIMVIPGVQAFYINVGEHIGRLLPYVQVDIVKQSVSSQLAQLNGPSELAPIIAGVNIFNSFMQSGTPRYTYSTGLRWSMSTTSDFKLQYDYIIKPAGQQSGFNYIDPNSNFIVNRQAIKVYSAAIDFVF